MRITAWNDHEEARLQGLPLEAQVLYLRGLRRHMDRATGLAGETRAISWQGLCEMLYVEPHQGRMHSGALHVSRVRRLMGWLVKAGLVEERRRKGRTDTLIFFLPLADRDESAQKKADKKPTKHPDIHPDKADTEEKLYSARSCGESSDVSRQPSRHPQTPKSRQSSISILEDLRGANAPVVLAFGERDQKPVTIVFEHWQRVMNKPKAKLGDKRRKAIAARLAEGYTVDDLKLAVDGCKASPWHQGKNDRKTVFDDLELICRSAGHVDRFVGLAGKDLDTEDAELERWVSESRVIEGVFRHV